MKIFITYPKIKSIDIEDNNHMHILKAASFFKKTESFLFNFYQTITSIFKVLILSDFLPKLPPAISDECLIIGNGPSMKQTIEKYDSCIKNKAIFTVNNIVQSTYFFEYKPTYHILHDPVYFTNKQRPDVIKTFKCLNQNIDWPLYLFIPRIFRRDVDVVALSQKNPKIKMCFYNYTIAHGFSFWTNFLYKKNLAMPQFYNVLGPSLMLAINMGYKIIWIAGVDHSWFKEIEVNSDNKLCRRDPHFYDSDTTPIKILVDGKNKEVNMGAFLSFQAKVFYSYYLIEKFSKSNKAKIYNASEYSLIDAFERKKLA